MKLTLAYRLAIILICSGIVLLGANDLYQLHRDKKLANRPADKIIAELREDPYARLATGTPIEEVGARSIAQRRASYPWERTEKQEERKVEISIFNRLEQAIMGDNNEDNK